MEELTIMDRIEISSKKFKFRLLRNVFNCKLSKKHSVYESVFHVVCVICYEFIRKKHYGTPLERIAHQRKKKEFLKSSKLYK